MNELLRHAQALARSGDFAAAADFCRRAIERGQEMGLAKRLLASCLCDLGLKLWLDGIADAAEEQFRAAIAVAPRHLDALNNLAAIRQLGGHYDEAIGLYRRALEVEPANVRVLENLAKVEQHVGRLEDAAAGLLKLANLAPRNGAAYLIREALLVHKIVPDKDYPGRVRRAIAAKLDAIERAGARMNAPLHFPSTYFPLSYHGLRNKELLRRVAEVHLKAAPSLAWSAPHVSQWKGPKRRMKIGFASHFFRAHSIANTSRGLIEHLDRDAHEVFLIRLGPSSGDESAVLMDKAADHVVTVPYDNLEKAREIVAGLELDILFYQDIGLEPLSYLLAFSRLAPVQLTSFGHPDTTGIANLDYFLSSENYEVEGAARDYSERLMLIPGAGTLSYYYRPPTASARSRESFGLHASDKVYLCPQALFKIHPVMDELFEAILENDAKATIVLLDPLDEELRPALERRFAQSISELRHRIVFVKQLPYPEFLALLACSDVILDTVHFNGQNTNLEALAMQMPVVTLPGRLQRERHTYGMYRAMGFAELVAGTADEYVALALRVANDANYREHCRARIGALSGVLYENADFVRSCEKAFRAMVEERRSLSA